MSVRPSSNLRQLTLTAVLLEDSLEHIAEHAAQIVLAQLEGTPPESPYLTVPEAAQYLRSSRQRVYDLLSAGRIARYKDGRRVLVLRDELDAYLDAAGRVRTVTTSSQPLQMRCCVGDRVEAGDR